MLCELDILVSPLHDVMYHLWAIGYQGKNTTAALKRADVRGALSGVWIQKLCKLKFEKAAYNAGYCVMWGRELDLVRQVQSLEVL